MTTRFNRGLTALSAIVIMLVGTVVAATPASSSTAASPIASLTNIRTGLNAGHDRIVLDLTDGDRPAVTSPNRIVIDIGH
jgi:hypothetical protein